LASVTQITLSTTTADSLGISEILDVIDDSTSTNKARISIRSNANGDASFFSFLVTSVTTHAGYYELNGTYVDGAAFSNTESIVFDFYQTGDIGATGATGDTGASGAVGATGATGPEGGSTTLTTKGDLLTRDSSALARLGVGTDGHVLTADSVETLGIKWAAASGGGGAFDDEGNILANQVFG
jgi:hypothetical protein